MNACALIGCRSQNLPYRNDERDSRCEQLKQKLFCEILRMTREGVNVFMSGMARGVDLWAAEAVLQIQNVKPSQKIELWAIVPYDRQPLAWSAKECARYRRILEQAAHVEYISHDYYNACLQKRNRFMVDHATHLLAVYDGQPGGTASTIRYARKKGLEITIIEP